MPPSMALFAPAKKPSKSYPLMQSSLASRSEFAGAASTKFASSSRRSVAFFAFKVRLIRFKFSLIYFSNTNIIGFSSWQSFGIL